MLYVYLFANKKIVQYTYSNLSYIIFNTKYETRLNAHRRYSLVGQETEVVSFLSTRRKLPTSEVENKHSYILLAKHQETFITYPSAVARAGEEESRYFCWGCGHIKCTGVEMNRSVC